MELDSILSGDRLSSFSNTVTSVIDAKFRAYGNQATAYASLIAGYFLNSNKKNSDSHLSPGHSEFIGPVLCESRRLYLEIMQMEGPASVKQQYGKLAPVVPFNASEKPAA